MVVVVVVVREGGGGGQRKGPNPENERNGSFSGGGL